MSKPKSRGQRASSESKRRQGPRTPKEQRAKAAAKQFSKKTAAMDVKIPQAGHARANITLTFPSARLYRLPHDTTDEPMCRTLGEMVARAVRIDYGKRSGESV